MSSHAQRRGQDERRPSPVKHACNVPHDQAVARLVGAKPFISWLKFFWSTSSRRVFVKRGTITRASGSSSPNHSLSHSVANRPALHEHDGCSPSGARSRKPMHVTGASPLRMTFSASKEGHSEVAFVADPPFPYVCTRLAAFLTGRSPAFSAGAEQSAMSTRRSAGDFLHNLTDIRFFFLLRSASAGFKLGCPASMPRWRDDPPLFRRYHLLYQRPKACSPCGMRSDLAATTTSCQATPGGATNADHHIPRSAALRAFCAASRNAPLNSTLDHGFPSQRASSSIGCAPHVASSSATEFSHPRSGG